MWYHYVSMAEIMVVDDIEDIRTLISVILKKAGHRVIACASGPEMLKKLGLQPNDKSAKLPDILVVDVMMPGMNGYTVGSSIRSDPRTQHIPNLVVSGLREINRLVAGTFPADCFLNKPFTPDELIGKVAMVLDKRQAQA